MTNPLPTAELAIYATLSLPVLFLLFRSGRAGLLGWFYLFAFCTLRIVGGAMSINNKNSSTAAIISNLGLSPLLLAASGVLHEARTRQESNLNTPVDRSLVAFFHIIVATGVALLGAGAAAIQSDRPKATDLQIIRVGISTLTASWVLLVLGAFLSALPSRSNSRAAAAYRDGVVLLISVAVSLVFIGIRILYSLVALCTRASYLNPVSGSLAIQVVLSFLPELIATLSLVAGGLWTQHASRKSNNLRYDRDRRRSSIKVRRVPTTQP